MNHIKSGAIIRENIKSSPEKFVNGLGAFLSWRVVQFLYVRLWLADATLVFPVRNICTILCQLNQKNHRLGNTSWNPSFDEKTEKNCALSDLRCSHL